MKKYMPNKSPAEARVVGPDQGELFIKLVVNLADPETPSSAVQDVMEQLDDPWTPIRQHLLHMYKVRNMRVSRDSECNIILLRIIPAHGSDVRDIITGYRTGEFQQAFSDYINKKSATFTLEMNTTLLSALADSMNMAEHLPVASVPDDVQRRSNIVANLVKVNLTDPDFHPSDLCSFLLRYKENLSFSHVISDDGLNLLHLIVKSSRSEFLHIIFYLNLWHYFSHDLIRKEKNIEYRYYTPRGLAEKLLNKSRGPATLAEYDHYDQLWREMPRLHRACIDGSFSTVQGIVSGGTEVNQTDRAGATAILYACANGNRDIINFLIRKRADPMLQNSRGENGLIIATKFGKLSTIKLLASISNINNQNQADKFKYRAIDYAAINGDTEAVKAIAGVGVCPDGKALSLAVKYQRRDMAEHLISEHNVDVNGVDDDGRTPLLNAAEKGHLELIKFLLEKGANLEHRDKQNRNCLHLVANSNQTEALRFLIKIDRDENWLHGLINDKDHFCGREQLTLVRGRDRGRPAWHYVSVKRTLTNIFKKKMESGQIDVKNFGEIISSGFGRSPSNEHEVECNRKLRNHSSDLTPLLVAAWRDHPEIATLLVEAGADVNKADRLGCTPLHFAAMRGNLELVKYLKEKGADLSCLNHANQTPTAVAEVNNHQSLVDYFDTMSQIKISSDFMASVTARFHSCFTNGTNKSILVQTCKDVVALTNRALLDLGSGPATYESQESVEGRRRNNLRDQFAGTEVKMHHDQMGGNGDGDGSTPQAHGILLTDVVCEEAHEL